MKSLPKSLRSRSSGSCNKLSARSSTDGSNQYHDSDSEKELQSDYAVEMEVRSASSDYSFDDWIEGKCYIMIKIKIFQYIEIFQYIRPTEFPF